MLSASNVEKQFGDAFDRVWCTEQINTYKWDEKSVESATTEGTTIEMSGNRYIKTMVTIVSIIQLRIHLKCLQEVINIL